MLDIEELLPNDEDSFEVELDLNKIEVVQSGKKPTGKYNSPELLHSIAAREEEIT